MAQLPASEQARIAKFQEKLNVEKKRYVYTNLLCKYIVMLKSFCLNMA